MAPPSTSTTDGETISSIFRQWCQMTVYHGVKDIYEAQNMATKILWTMVVIIGCFFAIIQSSELILEFGMDRKFQTTISSESPESGVMPYPNGTICQRNKLDVDRLKRYGFSDPYEIAYVFDQETGLEFYDLLQARFPMYRDKRDMDALIRNFQSIYTEYNETIAKLTTLSCKDTLLVCGHNQGFRSDPHCDCAKISTPHPSRPNCLKLNFESMFPQNDKFRTAGYGAGLRILLDPRVNYYYPHLLYNEKPESGLALRLYFGEEDADGLSTPVFLTPGTQTVVGMTAEKHRTTVRRRYTFEFIETKRPCVEKMNYTWVNSKYMSRTLCQWDCYARFLMEFEHCQCIFPINSVEFKGYHCNSSEDADCWNKLTSSEWWQLDLPSGFNFTTCMLDCKDACEYEKISVGVSTERFPAEVQIPAFARYLNRALAKPRNESDYKFTDDDVRQMILLELYYDLSDYRLVETVDRLSIYEMISQVGGTLGVWTGLSVIGILQAAVYVCRCAASAIRGGCPRPRRRRKKRRIEPSNGSSSGAVVVNRF